MKWWQKQELKLPVQMYVNNELHYTEYKDVSVLLFHKDEFEHAGYKVELKEIISVGIKR